MLDSGYFRELSETTATRVWINNPTEAEVSLAIGQSAVGCTTNPAFIGNLLHRVPSEVTGLISDVVACEPDDERAAERVQSAKVRSLLEEFAQLHQSSGGTLGFVSLQGSPLTDADPLSIERQAREARALGSNCIPKIPATAPGLAAFDVLVHEGTPTIVTEVFSLAQLVDACERYVLASRELTVRPAFFVAPITGIFGDYARAEARRRDLEVESRSLDLTGVLFARAAARVVREREYPVTLLFGGARSPVDLTGLVGSHHHATINWSTFAEILELNQRVRHTIDDEVPASISRSLMRIDAVQRALALDGLRLDEYESFGPVRLFRDKFVDGWQALLAAIATARVTSAQVGS